MSVVNNNKINRNLLEMEENKMLFSHYIKKKENQTTSYLKKVSSKAVSKF